MDGRDGGVGACGRRRGAVGAVTGMLGRGEFLGVCTSALLGSTGGRPVPP